MMNGNGKPKTYELTNEAISERIDAVQSALATDDPTAVKIAAFGLVNIALVALVSIAESLSTIAHSTCIDYAD